MPNLDTWKCESTFDANDVLEHISYHCMNKTSCTLNVNKYIHKQNAPKICIDDTAQFYIQAFCYHNPEQMEVRNRISMILSLEVVAVTMLYLCFMFYINRKLSDKYVEWDQRMTTISDYVCKYEIPKDLYERFRYGSLVG